MEAREIRVGDRFVQDGRELYVVEEIVDVVPSHVRVRVRYVDGGDGLRSWSPRDEVPLVRGES